MDSFPLENTNSAKKARRSKKQLPSNSQNITTTELNNNSNSNMHNNNNDNNLNSQVKSAPENSQTILQTEMLNYINKLEFLTLKTRLQLLRERKAYGHLFSSLAIFFDSKGIAAQKVQDYVDSVIIKLHDERESEQTDPADLDWLTFLKEETKQQQKKKNITDSNSLALNNGSIQSSLTQAPATTAPSNSSGQVNSNGGNIIRLQIAKQTDYSLDKTKNQVGKTNLKRGNKIDPPIDDPSADEPKLKRKKRIEPTTGINNSEITLPSQQVQQYYQSQTTQPFQPNAQQQQLSQQQIQQQNYLTQQEMFIQSIMKAQQRNQMVPNDQMMQQMIINIQQQQRSQQQQSMQFPLSD